ncbi:hypothetical protein MRB53_039859 [Persea americana]|nr:hypothetical protein MRB53_039859 [Persea americana]
MVESSLDKLWKGMLSSPSKDDRIEDEALFSLTDPFSELCLITEAHSLPNFKLSRSQPSNNVDFLPLDAGETIVYVSPADECPSNFSQRQHDLVRARTKQKAEHARRRSSFYTASHGTGTTTPAVRRDGLRGKYGCNVTTDKKVDKKGIESDRRNHNGITTRSRLSRQHTTVRGKITTEESVP